jgi:peptidase A4-like protein
MGRAAVLLVAIAALLTCSPAWAGGQPPTARLSVSPGRLSYLGGRLSLTWSSTHATTCTLSTNHGFFSGRKRARVRCNGRLSRILPPTSRTTHWTFTLRAASRSGRVAEAKRKFRRSAPPFLVSANWSGYVVSSTSLVTETSGQFTVPRLDCKRIPNSAESVWVGIGGAGASAGDLLQTGVRSSCIGASQAVNIGWWADFPAYREIDFDRKFISAGDSVRATVSRSTDGSWTTRLDDLTSGISGVMTTGKAFGTVRDSSPTVWLDQQGSASGVSYAGGYSAEWIVEDFEEANGMLATVADFGTVAFTGLTTSLPSWGLTSDERVGLGDYGGNLWAVPSAPDPSGRGFSIRFVG